MMFARILIVTLLTVVTNPAHWDILKTKNDPGGRSECGMAAVNGELFLIGGDGGSKSVEVYNPASMTWTRKSVAPLEMHHFQAVALKNRIFILGAFYQGMFPDQMPMSNVYSYDTKKAQWTKHAEIPESRRRAASGAAAHKGRIYQVGGITNGHLNGTNAKFDEYDPSKDKWTALPDAPHARDHCAAAVIGDKLYAIGGRNTSYHEPNNFTAFFSKTILEVDCYDFKTKKWSVLAAKLPLGSGGGTAVSCDGKLFYIAGERATATDDNGPQKNTYVLNPAKDQVWTEIESLNLARHGMQATVLKNKIYVAGGISAPGPPPRTDPSYDALHKSDSLRKGAYNGSVSLEIYVPE